MVRERPNLGVPFGADGPWLQAILDVLGDLHDLIDTRLPVRDDSGGAVRVTEPTPAVAPGKAIPVAEPAPDTPPAPAVPGEEPDPDNEPDKTAAVDLPPSPPARAGRGSSLKAWQAWADQAQVGYAADASRDDIIAACIESGVLPADG